MARAATGDFLQGFRFHVWASSVAGSGWDPFQVDRSGGDGANFGMNPQAGFQSATIPEISLDAVEYREGNSARTLKQNGIPTVSDGTLMRGVTKLDTTFHDWIVRCISGQEYRCDLVIAQYARDEMADGTVTTTPVTPERPVYVFECIPLRDKVMGDLDSTGSEVSLMEVDYACEWIDTSPTPSI